LIIAVKQYQRDTTGEKSDNLRKKLFHENLLSLLLSNRKKQVKPTKVVASHGV
jgi:hypothetical protein